MFVPAAPGTDIGTAAVGDGWGSGRPRPGAIDLARDGASGFVGRATPAGGLGAPKPVPALPTPHMAGFFRPHATRHDVAGE